MKRGLIFCLTAALALLMCACSSSADTAYTVGEYVVDQENRTISDGTSVYQYTFSGDASRYSIEITYPDGSSYWWHSEGSVGWGGWSEDYDEDRYVSGDVLRDVLEAGAPKEAKPGKVLAVLFLLAVGVFNIASPQTAWHLSEGWKFRDAEPSELALGLARAGGVACCAAAVIVIFAW